ncbi:MAG: hypothetical protein IID28_03765 [Planctomycetes bacterium]|nr:hypothetical protein [Planctomycetota bacterium]
MTSLANMKIVDVLSEPTPTDLHTATARVDEQIALTQNQLDDYDLWFSQRKSEVANLKSEQEFHQIQKDVGSLVSGRAQMDVVDSSFRDLVAFGASVQSILDTTEDALKDQLEAALPVLADNLSNVFASLTHHPWYDRLVIPGERLPKLELRVASSSEEEGNSYPPDVLNGQAQSALELVPYFAFSQEEDTPTEVYLVLLDDPTQSFDDEHMDILVERLAQLGEAQAEFNRLVDTGEVVDPTGRTTRRPAGPTAGVWGPWPTVCGCCRTGYRSPGSGEKTEEVTNRGGEETNRVSFSADRKGDPVCYFIISSLRPPPSATTSTVLNSNSGPMRGWK